MLSILLWDACSGTRLQAFISDYWNHLGAQALPLLLILHHWYYLMKITIC